MKKYTNMKKQQKQLNGMKRLLKRNERVKFYQGMVFIRQTYKQNMKVFICIDLF